MTDHPHDPKELIAEAASRSGLLDAVVEFAWVARHNPNTAPPADWGSECCECVLYELLNGLFLDLSEEVDAMRKELFGPSDPKAQPGARAGEFEDFLRSYGLDVLE